MRCPSVVRFQHNSGVCKNQSLGISEYTPYYGSCSITCLKNILYEFCIFHFYSASFMCSLVDLSSGCSLSEKIMKHLQFKVQETKAFIINKLFCFYPTAVLIEQVQFLFRNRVCRLLLNNFILAIIIREDQSLCILEPSDCRLEPSFCRLGPGLCRSVPNLCRLDPLHCKAEPPFCRPKPDLCRLEPSTDILLTKNS